MVVRRVYIKGNSRDFDSVTFSSAKKKGQPFNGRFWVKLADANNICAELVDKDTPKETKPKKVTKKKEVIPDIDFSFFTDKTHEYD